jgi:hypothetical protein
VKYSRFEVWYWAIANDPVLRRVLTNDGHLSWAMAVDHLVQCYDFHSRLIHGRDFSVYKKVPVLNKEEVNKGYITNQLPFKQTRHCTRMEAESTVHILLKLSEFAGFVNPECINID